MADVSLSPMFLVIDTEAIGDKAVKAGFHRWIDRETYYKTSQIDQDRYVRLNLRHVQDDHIKERLTKS